MTNAGLLGAGMSFVNPSLAAAALAMAALPLLIHLLNRRRFRRMPWAAMNFLLAASRRSARRVRFEQFVLLALRTAAVLCVGLAIARPFVPAGLSPVSAATSVHRVLLIDDSLSMQMHDEAAVSRFADARAAAQALLDSFPGRDPVSIVTLADPANPLVRVSVDRRVLRETLAALPATQRGADVAGGLATALDMLEEADVAPDSAAVYLLSDVARTAWGADGGDTEWAGLWERLGSRARLHVVQCHRRGADNLAVVAFAPRERLVRRGEIVRLFADVANFSARPARRLQLNVLRGERVVRRVPVPEIGPETTQRVTFSLPAMEADATPLEVRLQPAGADALEIDDRRLLTLQAADHLPVLVVEGRRGADPFSGDAGFLVTAMAPGARDRRPTALQPKRIAPADFPDEPLSDYRLVVLCNVDRLDPATWLRLQTYVREGGGVLVTAGDAVDFDDYNASGYHDGSGLLPGRLVGHGPTPEGADRFVRFAPGPQSGALAEALGANPNSGLFHAAIRRYVAIDVSETRGQVRARFDDGAPAVVVGRLGRGHVGVLATAVDMSWSNLPAKGDFVSLTQKLVGELASPPAGDAEVIVGRTYRRLLAPDEVVRPQHVTDPDGRELAVRIGRADARYYLECDEIRTAGFHLAGSGGADQPFAVNVDPRESDPRCLDESALRKQLGDKIAYTVAPDVLGAPGLGGAVSELAGWLTYLGLLVLACETWAAMRFGANR